MRNTKKNSEFTGVTSQGKSRTKLEGISNGSRRHPEENSNKTRMIEAGK